MNARLLRYPGLLAGVVMIVAACGGAGTATPSARATASPSGAATTSASATAAATTSPSGASVAPSGSAAPPEVSALTVGTLPIVDVAPVHLAIRDGLFQAEGLTVTTEVMQGGAAAIPALVAGDLDIAFGAWPSFLNANQQGIPLRAIADGVAAKPGFTLFLALPASGLEGKPAGMAGKTIAVNTLNNLGELSVRSALKEAGADPQNVKLVEIPFPDMGAALERGNVDVIWAVEPSATNVKNALKAVVVADSYVGPMDGFPVAGFQVTEAFAKANPNTVAAFQRAITKAAERAQDRQTVIDLIPTYTTLTPALATQLSLPEYRGKLDVANLQRVYDYLVTFGILKEGLDVSSLVVSSP